MYVPARDAAIKDLDRGRERRDYRLPTLGCTPRHLSSRPLKRIAHLSERHRATGLARRVCDRSLGLDSEDLGDERWENGRNPVGGPCPAAAEVDRPGLKIRAAGRLEGNRARRDGCRRVRFATPRRGEQRDSYESAKQRNG